MKENPRERPMSLLLIKPEFFMLAPEVQELVMQTLTDSLGCSILETHVISLKHDQASSLWNNVDNFPWAPAYYDAMSSDRSVVFVLEGNDRADSVKKSMRQTFESTIRELTERIGMGYQADIFHGSEPGSEERELNILGILENVN